MVDYQIVNRPPAGLDMILTYLSEREIEQDPQIVLLQQIRSELDYPEATLKFDRVPTALGRLSFRGRNSALDRKDQEALDQGAAYLKQHSKLRLEIVGIVGEDQQPDKTTQERIDVVREYLSSHWQIADDRIVLKQGESGASEWSVRLKIATDVMDNPTS